MACKIRYMQLWRACLAAMGVGSAAQDQQHLLTGIRVRIAGLTTPQAPYDATAVAAAVARTAIQANGIASMLLQLQQEVAALGRRAASFDQALTKVEAAVPTAEEAQTVHRCVVQRVGPGAQVVMVHVKAATGVQVCLVCDKGLHGRC